MTDWVIEQACRALNTWEREGVMIEQVAINIPGPYLTSISLMNVLKEMTEKYKIKLAAIELEITEMSFAKPMKMDELKSWVHVFTMKMNV